MFTIVQSGFFLLTLICLVFIDRVFFSARIVLEKRKTYRKRFWIISSSWLVVVSILSISGFFKNFSSFPPRPFILLIIPLVLFLALMFNRAFTSYLHQVSIHKVILLQSFRIIVELFLWMLFIDGTMPVQMTFEQCNLDVLTGLTAPIVGYLVYKKPKISKVLGISWNFVGLLLLINVVTVAVLSMPTPLRQFMNEPANTAVAVFPITFLPAILVPMAYYLHFISLKQLLKKKIQT